MQVGCSLMLLNASSVELDSTNFQNISFSIKQISSTNLCYFLRLTCLLKYWLIDHVPQTKKSNKWPHWHEARLPTVANSIHPIILINNTSSSFRFQHQPAVKEDRKVIIKACSNSYIASLRASDTFYSALLTKPLFPSICAFISNFQDLNYLAFIFLGTSLHHIHLNWHCVHKASLWTN